MMRHKRPTRLSTKLMVPVALIGVVLLGVSSAVLLAVKQRSTMLAGLNTAQALVNQIVTLRTFYTEEIATRAKKAGIRLNHDFAQHDDVLPLPATLVHTLGEKLAQDYPGTIIRLYSRYPFPHRAASQTYDAFEQSALATLERDPKTPVSTMETVNGRLSVRYAVADLMRPACVGCHNAHAESPKKDWKEGDIRGVVEAVVPVDTLEAGITTGMQQLGGTLLAGLVLAIGLIFLLLRRLVLRPVNALRQAAQRVSDGDLTVDIPVHAQDEVGALAGIFNRMTVNLQQLPQAVAANTVPLRMASEELSSVAEHMAQQVSAMSRTSNTAAAATQEMSASMRTASAVADQAASNVHMVATATEQMTSTVQEIAHNAEKARQVTSTAVHSVSDTCKRVGELGQAAQDISKVTDVIMEIAEQTKLLALNATIEAARAGEAGKGFAVVANEVKELATQTNAATEDIRVKIEAMQRSTDGTVQEISHIQRIITDVSELVASIATAVEEQAITTRDIAANIGQASTGIQEMASTVTQASQASQTITTDVVTMSQSSGEMTTVGAQLTTQATELARLGHILQEMVEKYTLTTTA